MARHTITLQRCSVRTNSNTIQFLRIATVVYLMSAPRGEAARQRILDATRDVLLDQGLGGFTVEAVASVSGAARSTIYRHWPDPHDLVVDTLTSMASALPIPDTGTLRGDLEACVRLLRPVFDDPKTRRLFLDVTRAATSDPDLERIRNRALQERRQPVQVILQRAIQRGEIDPDLDMTMAMHLVEGPMMSATILQNLPLTDETTSAFVERIVKALA